jgi:RHS repeat-associated protein
MAGDMTADSANLYLYDAEGRVCAEGEYNSQWNYAYNWVQFLYDADGHRVAKGKIAARSCDTTANGFVLTNQYILGPNGEQMTELTPATTGVPPTWLHTNAFAGSTLVATYVNDGLGEHFRLTDWLGTIRAQVSPAGVVETSGGPFTCRSYPFGELGNGNYSLSQLGGSSGWGSGSQCEDATEQVFTGKERDFGVFGGPGNDFFGARYYNSATGRFLSPDWTAKSDDPVPYANLTNPQSLNLYAYVGGNPLLRTDPTGHCALQGVEVNCMALSAVSKDAIKTEPTAKLSARDRSYLDKYYKPIHAKAGTFKVDDAQVLGVGIESGFGSNGTYLRTGDAFGMTGGSTKHMTSASSPEANVSQFFEGYGNQIRGTSGSDPAFVNGIEGEDANGKAVKGWKTYNTVNPEYKSFITSGIKEMRRDLDVYLGPVD